MARPLRRDDEDAAQPISRIACPDLARIDAGTSGRPHGRLDRGRDGRRGQPQFPDDRKLAASIDEGTARAATSRTDTDTGTTTEATTTRARAYSDTCARTDADTDTDTDTDTDRTNHACECAAGHADDAEAADERADAATLATNPATAFTAASASPAASRPDG